MSKKGIEDLKKEYKEIRMSEAQVDAFKQSIEKAKKDNRKRSSLRVWKNAGTIAAAVLITFIILPNTSAGVAHAMAQIPLIGNVVKVVTFRDYQYDSGTQIADVNVPNLEVDDTGISLAQTTDEEGVAYDGETEEALPIAFSLKESTSEINADIEALTAQIIEEFEADVRMQTGVKEVLVSHETVATPEQYFTLKLSHYEASADGVENVYYYTIDLTTGERITLADLFVEDADYVSAISEEIKRQMREHMASDEDAAYWLDEEIDEWNFKEITGETQFYVNADNQLVISFNEGEVAPMYMGVVNFEMPEEVLSGIRK